MYFFKKGRAQKNKREYGRKSTLQSKDVPSRPTRGMQYSICQLREGIVRHPSAIVPIVGWGVWKEREAPPLLPLPSSNRKKEQALQRTPCPSQQAGAQPRGGPGIRGLAPGPVSPRREKDGSTHKLEC